ncbi:flagellar hook assembly protein FlgD [Clostridium pasteurianum]|uniref:Flagellar hook capping protein n=1 Tax=Clostridium pasteurianum BC1 TaxID=86416 RepID=R4KB64_CLOPA|nr:flagellar hook capping FlgD N-terminal domain-containing protein [Clostridium pasteurianum]AGK97769.1 flagellar hook capping protein [Clostridium pasteurianum BC1]
MAVTSSTATALTGYQTTSNTSGATDRGTPMIKPGQQGIDKNSFLKILTAELSNQDPLSGSNQDSTQYVAQLAQFTSLEQMANLNSTLTLNSASNLLGKTVMFNETDSMNNNYIGQVNSITKQGDTITLTVATSDNGKALTKDFDYGDIYQINPDTSSSSTDSSSDSSSNANV